MKFAFKATRPNGEVFEGVVEAADKFALARDMRAEGKVLLFAHPADDHPKSLNNLFSGLFARVSFKEKIFFANNLSEMISAGLSLSRALSVLSRQSQNKEYKKVLDTLLNDINAGGSFASSLAKFPKVFSPIFVAMTEAGEKSGQLPQSLRIVSEQMNKSYSLRKKIRGALIYPAVIIAAMLGIAILMMIYVVPTLAKTFNDIGADLPFTTKLLIGASGFLVAHGVLVLIAVIILVIVLIRLSKTNRGKRTIGFALLRLPIISNIIREFNAAVTARTISSLISSGVDIVEALRITEKVLQNSYYQEVIHKAVDEIPKGKNLSAIFQEAEKLYPVFVGEMTEVGEETGKLADMLLKLAIFYENEVDAITKDLSTVIEPLIMIVVGAGVGFFALSMIQPIYSIGDKL